MECRRKYLAPTSRYSVSNSPSKERTNTSLLQEVIVNNLTNNEFFIQKAIGWALREYARTDDA